MNRRIKQQEQEKKAKADSKAKKAETVQPRPIGRPNTINPIEPRKPNYTPPSTPPYTPTMSRNGEEKPHYWSLRDIPKFEGKGEQPFSHLMEFEDYLTASGVRIEPEIGEDGNVTTAVNYKDTINKFKASLKNNARVWYKMYIEGRVQNIESEEGWKAIKSKFLTYFNPTEPR